QQLEALAEICDQFTPSRSCHLTTRQDVQLYGIDRPRLPALLRRLAAAGLTTREASGNVVRNVTCCPWAGISPEESFDITPYAQAMSDYFLRNPVTQLLPRKVKIAFEGCSVDHARVLIHDIGVVAASKGDEPGFRIFIGGGLGPTPRAAQLLEPWTSAEWLLPTMEAVLRMFDRLGERRVRARARLKFLIEEVGWSAFRQWVLDERQAVWATQSGQALGVFAQPVEQPPVAEQFLVVTPRDEEAFNRWRATNVSAQQQDGFVSVLIRVPFGDITADQLREVSRLAQRCAWGIRLTNTQNLLLRFVPRTALSRLYNELARVNLALPFANRLADITRCPGADSCLSAITHPRGLAQALDALMRNGLSSMAEWPLSIKISGCPNSCGHHHIADIGCFGMAVKVGERHLPCYQLLIGGGTSTGSAQFGQRLVRVPAGRAPEAINRLLHLYATERQQDESFPAFISRIGLELVQKSLQDLTDLTGVEQQPELWTDLGDDEPFVLAAGKGECAE
ncbi:MAG: nitrite/sulfite reductase, partial [Candidatus Omnitrophica bacterium]|nr:nitrite/sulfite reductase [Candidatus Omnitrophota bacterium]